MFSYKDYKVYVKDRLSEMGRGAKSKLAEEIACKPSYITQVLDRSSEFSLEQAEEINRFFEHSDFESQFFIVLVEYGRAGSARLKKRLSTYLEELRAQSKKLSKRAKAARRYVSDDYQQYFSSWIYAAVHVIVSIPQFQTSRFIAERLRVERSHIEKVLEFLIELGLVEESGGKFKSTENSISLPSESRLLPQHHTNWRLQSLKSFDVMKLNDVHYSGVFTGCEKDREVIHHIMMEAIQKIREQLSTTEKEEQIFALSMDSFEL